MKAIILKKKKIDDIHKVFKDQKGSKGSSSLFLCFFFLFKDTCITYMSHLLKIKKKDVRNVSRLNIKKIMKCLAFLL